MTAERALPAAVVERVARASYIEDAACRMRNTVRPSDAQAAYHQEQDYAALRWDDPMFRDGDGLIHRPHQRELAAAALAEFLATLEERGLRVVPVEATPEMMERGKRYRDSSPSERYGSEFWRAMLAAAPPLAELLEDG